GRRRAGWPRRLVPRPDRGGLPGAEVPPPHRAVLAGAIDLVGVVGIDLALEPVAATDRDPVLVDRAGAVVGPAGSTPASVVLEAPVDLVIPRRIEGDVIDLADGRVVEVVPVLHPVAGDIQAAVAPQDHVPAVVRVDPERVVVRVDATAAITAEGLAAVGRPVEADSQHSEVLLVIGVHAALAEVHGTRVEAVDPRPGLAAV